MSPPPLVISGTLTAGAGSVFNLNLLGTPLSGNSYLFIQYGVGSTFDPAASFSFTNFGAFTATPHKIANSLTVTLS